MFSLYISLAPSKTIWTLILYWALFNHDGFVPIKWVHARLTIHVYIGRKLLSGAGGRCRFVGQDIWVYNFSDSSKNELEIRLIRFFVSTWSPSQSKNCLTVCELRCIMLFEDPYLDDFG